MNIFLLDEDPALCARYHCDKHVVKMVLETTQILSTVARGLGHDVGYKPTHAKHPSVLWAGKNSITRLWTYALGLELGKEYTHRYGKTHKSVSMLLSIGDALKLYALDVVDLDKDTGPYPLAVGVDTKKELGAGSHTAYASDAIRVYRHYYFKEKYAICKWTNRREPYWWVDKIREAKRKKYKS